MRVSRRKLAYTCLVLAPVLSNYVLVSAISIGDFVAIVGFVLLYFQARPRATLRSLAHISLFFLLIVVAYLSWAGQVESGFYRLLLYSIMLMMLTHFTVNRTLFWSTYQSWATFFSASLFLQWALYQLGPRVPLQLPLVTYELDTLQVVDHVFRSGGWFREPSYFLIFLMPVLIYQARSAKWSGFAFNFAAALASTSSLTFVIVSVVILEPLFRGGVGISIRARLPAIAFAAACIALLVIGVWLTQDSLFTSRFIEILFGGGSFAERIGPIGEYFSILFSAMPNPLMAKPILALSRDGVIWLSSAPYMMLMFGGLATATFFVGMLYLRPLAFTIFFAMIFVTSFMSSAYAVLFALGLHLCFSAPTSPIAPKKLRPI